MSTVISKKWIVECDLVYVSGTPLRKNLHIRHAVVRSTTNSRGNDSFTTHEFQKKPGHWMTIGDGWIHDTVEDAAKLMTDLKTQQEARVKELIKDLQQFAKDEELDAA